MEQTLTQMRVRLDEWTRQTDYPLLDGPVPLPEGAYLKQEPPVDLRPSVDRTPTTWSIPG